MNSSIGRRFVPEKHKEFWKHRRYMASYGNKQCAYLMPYDPLMFNMQNLPKKGHPPVGGTWGFITFSNDPL